MYEGGIPRDRKLQALIFIEEMNGIEKDLTASLIKVIYLYLTEASTDAGCSDSSALRGSIPRGRAELAKPSHDFSSF